jgi:putative intracellular protease/amidase
MSITTAILVFDDVQIIDYTGPFEALGRRGPTFLVAETPELVTNMGMKVTANYTFADAPAPDVLVIPGGGSSGERQTRRYGVGVAIERPAVIDWIRRTAEQAQFVLSVCNGAFLAQRAGLLDGLTATTTAGYIDYLARIAPSTKVVRDQRVVDNGKVVVTGGLSAGIDGALRIIEKAEGFGTAVETALQMEYDWRPNDGWSRAVLADIRVPQGIYAVFHGEGTRMLEFESRPQRGREVWSTVSDLAPHELLRRIDATLDADGWARTPNAGNLATATGTDQDGTVWEVAIGVEPAAVGDSDSAELRCHVTIEIARR